MKVSPAGIALIKSFEGFRSEAYHDVVGVLTIGYGFTEGVKLGDTMTQRQADVLLVGHLNRYEAAVMRATGGNCTQAQFDALCSFAFNVGTAGMAKSTVIKCHNRGDYQAAARAFGLWNRAGGKEWPGLTRRRAAEAALYLQDDAEQPMPQEVEPESKLTASPIAQASTVTAITTVAATVAKDVKEIRDGFGDVLPYVLVAAGVAAAGYVIWMRLKQRAGGWA